MARALRTPSPEDIPGLFRGFLGRTATVALALALVGVVHGDPEKKTPAHAKAQGDWTLSGKNAHGSYGGGAVLGATPDGRATLSLTLDYDDGSSGAASFVGAWKDATTLEGKRFSSKGLVAVLQGASEPDGTDARYVLSKDGKTLEGTYGKFSEKLVRAGATAKLVILHTNDLHGQVVPVPTPWGSTSGGYASIVARLSKERSDALASGAGVLLLDAGDTFFGSPEGDQTAGRLVLDLVDLAGYDAVAVGNHDFDLGVSALAALTKKAKFPVVSANLKLAKTGKSPAGVKASVRKVVAGVDVCIIGVITNSPTQIDPDARADLAISAERDAIQAELDANEDADVFVLLSHAGDLEDRNLGKKFHDQLAVIVSGHTHVPIDTPFHVGDEKGPLMARAAAYGESIGRIDLEVDRKTKRVVSSKGRLIEIGPKCGQDEEVAALLAKGSKKIDAALDEKLGTLDVELHRRADASSALGDLVCDLMRAHVAACDVAILNKAGLRADLQKGDVTLRDLYRVAPFEKSPLAAVSLAGADLRKLLEKSFALGAPLYDVSGAVIHWDSTRKPGHRLVSVEVGGKPLDDDGAYRVVMDAFLAQEPVCAAAKDEKDYATTVLDLLERHFKKGEPTPATVDERLIDDGAK